MQNQNENTTSQISPSVTECVPKSAKVFPSVATVKEAYEKNREQIIPFSELPTGVVLNMYNVQSLRTKGERTSYYAEFWTEGYEKYYKTWIPKTVFNKFHGLEVEECVLVKNKGKIRRLPNNTVMTYWSTIVGILQ